MRFAYADPPYVGCANLYPEKAEVDHEVLIRRLVADYADGWAMSCSTPSLAYLLRLCHENDASDVRIMAWVKPFAVFKPNVGVAYAWEPVLFRGGRKRTREQMTIRDWFAHSIALKRGLVGAKPESFCRWILDVLNFQPGDTLDDLFPGTGVMARVIAQGDLLAGASA